MMEVLGLIFGWTLMVGICAVIVSPAILMIAFAFLWFRDKRDWRAKLKEIFFG